MSLTSAEDFVKTLSLNSLTAESVCIMCIHDPCAGLHLCAFHPSTLTGPMTMLSLYDHKTLTCVQTHAHITQSKQSAVMRR